MPWWSTDTKPDLGARANKEIKFSLHGEIHTLNATNAITPYTTLYEYLRYNAGLYGTKSMCLEGGCGACVVAVTKKNMTKDGMHTIAVNSCLIPILSCHGWEIETVKGIGNHVIGYNSIQEAITRYSASQCGFCTPGMVMMMYSKTQGDDFLTKEQVENSFSGNLCRCTGYRPLLDAFKSLASDIDADDIDALPDIEDIKLCKVTGKKCAKACPVKLENKPIMLKFDNENWYKANDMEDIYQLFKMIPSTKYRFVAGDTAKGVYKKQKDYDYWIDITNVKALTTYSVESGKLALGANIPLEEFSEICVKVADENPDFWYLKKISRHIQLVANVPVRNTGTVAGNLSMKHEHNEFPSDVFLLLETCKAILTIAEKTGNEVEKTPADYLKMDMNHCIIKTITLYPLKKENYLFESYKICPRIQNAHAYVNAGILLNVNNYVVEDANIVYGGINPEFIHAKNTESYLKGKNITNNDTLKGCLEALNKEIVPDYVLPDATPKYRKALALALFYKFILKSIPPENVKDWFRSGGPCLERPISKGTQLITTNEALYPLTEPIPKLESLIQSSGEAEYVDDIPPMKGELYACPVLVDAKPFSSIENIDISEAQKMPGFIAFVHYKDVPGINSFTSPIYAPTPEKIFCEDHVDYNGQLLGLIVGASQNEARAAATKVSVKYGAPKKRAILNIQQAIKEDPSRIVNIVDEKAKSKGNNVKHTLKGSINLKGQYHFTMETQRCICIPTDDGGLHVKASSQWIALAQHACSLALNIPVHKIDIDVKRLGGAYGSKIVRASMVICACAVATHKVGKPVRLILSLSENMKSLGKRTPTSCNYEVGIDNSGVIQYLNLKLWQDYGTSGVNEQAVQYIKNYIETNYVTDTWTLNGNRVDTDMPGNAFCRAPGSCEGIAIIEYIMDQISYQVDMDPFDVRLANMKPENETMKNLIDEFKTWTDYEKRKTEVESFNKKNCWKKRGIRPCIMKYPMEIIGPFSVYIAIYVADGTVAITHGGVECGQGIHTKVAQVCAYKLKIPLNMISVRQTTNITSPNNAPTGGSLTSEAVCYGVIQACDKILERLKPIREKLDNPTWHQLIIAAFQNDVELCETAMFSKSSAYKSYDIYGICLSEVEVDALTGEHNILRADILEDVGQSMSPSIDIGQIEGAFVMGLGYHTCENLIYDDDGALLTDTTWTYKIPGAKEIPIAFNVKFKQNSTNPLGVLNSKATAEPPLTLSYAVPLSIGYATYSTKDPKSKSFPVQDGPRTVEETFLQCDNDFTKYVLK